MSLKDPNVVNAKKTKRVAMVLSNPALSTTTGWPVGFWWSELSHPYFFLNEKGYGVDIFSPDGGKCEADAMSDPRDPSGYSDNDIVSLGFISTPKLTALIENTGKVSAIDVGQGPMFTSRARPICTTSSSSSTRPARSRARCGTASPCCVSRG